VTRAASLEAIRLGVAAEEYPLALEDAGRAIDRYGESALLRSYEGESFLCLALLPKYVPKEAQARSLDRRAREEADAKALAKLRAGEPEQLARAEAKFRRALELDPSLAPARRGLGETLLHRGDAAGGKAALAEYLAQNPGAPDAKRVAKLLAGGAATASGGAPK
jgi:tetratricopeptide repeat protein